ncbi:MAG: hypothetical protein WDA06_04585 [Phenylobacterium sp.]
MAKDNKVKCKEIKTIDDLYKAINRVQQKHESLEIKLTDETLSPVVENIIADSSLIFEKSEQGKSIVYLMSPGEIDFSAEIQVKELEDEFLEDGQLF